ncbi:MAG: DNA-3-methyladenine glycosylase I [Geminicoccaceae bacterium]
MAQDGLIEGEDGLLVLVAGKDALCSGPIMTMSGCPVSDDHRLFEKICTSFQAGLSLTILKKRENFRAAFSVSTSSRSRAWGRWMSSG